MKRFIDSTIFVLSLMGGHLKGGFLSKRLMLDVFIAFSKWSYVEKYNKHT